DGIRDFHVTGVQTCALPIYRRPGGRGRSRRSGADRRLLRMTDDAVPDLRASDADRERVADILREALAEGRLDMEEFGERLDATRSEERRVGTGCGAG